MNNLSPGCGSIYGYIEHHFNQNFMEKTLQNMYLEKARWIMCWGWLIVLTIKHKVHQSVMLLKQFPLDLLSGRGTSALFKRIKPQIYLGGSDWSIRGSLLTSHPPYPVLMLAKRPLSTEAFCWNKQRSSSSRWANLCLDAPIIIRNHRTAALISILPKVEEINGIWANVHLPSGSD